MEVNLLGFHLRKIYEKILSYRLSRSIIAALIMAVSIFLLGGGIYDIFMNPPVILPVGEGRLLPFIPYDINRQLLIGSIGVIILYALGALGLLIIYHSTRYVHNQRTASFLIGIGMGFLLISFGIIESIIFWMMNY
ncbi:MAG TPA: hypothetical protein ENG65_04045 [Candidatus Bathyarchaeota archaeon]|nr:hypothetical protein [Candidatus Bathyarchaeota archaeon]